MEAEPEKGKHTKKTGSSSLESKKSAQKAGI